MPEEHCVTSEMLWQAAVIFGLVDAVFVAILVKRINREQFRGLRTVLAITSGVFWFLVWILMSVFFWVPVYHYVFPEWARWLIPCVYGPLFGLLALLFWNLALRIPGNPVVNFCILGGLWGMATHIWAIYRGLLEGPPMLRGADPVAIAVMPVFEFIFYWCLILTASSSVQRHLGKKEPERPGGE